MSLWKLITLRCDVQTISSVFKTSKMHRKLSEDDILWKELSYRDFDRREEKEYYIARHFLGSHFIAFGKKEFREQVVVRNPKGINLLIETEDHFFLTYRKPKEIEYPDLTLITDTFVVNNVMYMSHFGRKTIMSKLDPPTKEPIRLGPLFEWVEKHFVVASGSYLLGEKEFGFQGLLRKGCNLFENDRSLCEYASEYWVTYEGILSVDWYGSYSISENKPMDS